MANNRNQRTSKARKNKVLETCKVRIMVASESGE